MRELLCEFGISTFRYSQVSHLGKGINVLAAGCSKGGQKEYDAMLANCPLDPEMCQLFRLTAKACTAEFCATDRCNTGGAAHASASSAGAYGIGGAASALASALLALLLVHAHAA